MLTQLQPFFLRPPTDQIPFIFLTLFRIRAQSGSVTQKRPPLTPSSDFFFDWNSVSVWPALNAWSSVCNDFELSPCQAVGYTTREFLFFFFLRENKIWLLIEFISPHLPPSSETPAPRSPTRLAECYHLQAVEGKKGVGGEGVAGVTGNRCNFCHVHTHTHTYTHSRLLIPLSLSL